MTNNQQSDLDAILDLDSALQQGLRATWPEAWLDINLPLGSTRALLAIESGSAHTPGGVAEVLGVSRTTVTGLLDRLEHEDLLTRTVDPHDRRCFLLELTARGRDLVADLDRQRRDYLRQGLARLAPDDLQALATGLAALVAAIGRDTPQDS